MIRYFEEKQIEKIAYVVYYGYLCSWFFEFVQ